MNSERIHKGDLYYKDSSISPKYPCPTNMTWVWVQNVSDTRIQLRHLGCVWLDEMNFVRNGMEIGMKLECNDVVVVILIL